MIAVRPRVKAKGELYNKAFLPAEKVKANNAFITTTKIIIAILVRLLTLSNQIIIELLVRLYFQFGKIYKRRQQV